MKIKINDLRKLELLGFAFLTFWSLILTLAVIKPAKIPQELRAEKFILIDDRGRVRADLLMNEDCPTLMFYDENDNPRVIIDQSQIGLEDKKIGSSYLFSQGFIIDKDSKTQIRLSTDPVSFGLELYSKGETFLPRASLTLNRNNPEFLLCDKEGEEKVTISVSENGSNLGLFGPARKEYISLGGDKDGPRILLFNDKKNGFREISP